MTNIIIHNSIFYIKLLEFWISFKYLLFFNRLWLFNIILMIWWHRSKCRNMFLNKISKTNTVWLPFLLFSKWNFQMEKQNIPSIIWYFPSLIEIVDDDIHISSLRQLDHQISAALMAQEGSLHTLKSSPNNMSSSMTNTGNRHLGNRSFGVNQNMGNSYHMNLNQINGSTNGDNYQLETTRAFPYERLTQVTAEPTITINTNSNNSNKNPNMTNYRGNSTCKIYQDLDEFKGHLV